MAAFQDRDRAMENEVAAVAGAIAEGDSAITGTPIS
jgi:hypothetical protein